MAGTRPSCGWNCWKTAEPRGKLILVTAITPTSHGEGKTVVSIGLAQALEAAREAAVVTLREPSLGPVFGLKGGATGGGRSQVMPAEMINLHFNGDFHAVTSAHNLLAAMIDSHLHHCNDLRIDVDNIFWPRAIDMNDRALRHVIVGLGGKVNGVPRETGFVITAASRGDGDPGAGLVARGPAPAAGRDRDRLRPGWRRCVRAAT